MTAKNTAVVICTRTVYLAAAEETYNEGQVDTIPAAMAKRFKDVFTAAETTAPANDVPGEDSAAVSDETVNTLAPEGDETSKDGD